AEQLGVAGARVTRDRPSLRTCFLDDEIRLLAGLLLERDRGLLGGDERRSQEAFELAVADEVRLELLDLVREVGAFTPDVLEAGDDLVEHVVNRRSAIAAEERARRL